MKIRNQLIIVLSLLAGLPLISIVLFSYLTSLRALQAAEEAEARLKADRLEEQLESVQADFTRRLTALEGMSMRALWPTEGEETGVMAKRMAATVLRSLGDSAEIVSTIEFVPAAPTPPAAPKAEARNQEGRPVAKVRPAPEPRREARVEPVIVDLEEVLAPIEDSVEALVLAGEEPDDEFGVQLGRIMSQGLDEFRFDLEAIEDLDGFDVVTVDETGGTEWVFSDGGVVVPVMGDEARLGGLRIGVGEQELAQAILKRPLSEREGDLSFAFAESGELFLADATLREQIEPLAQPAIAAGGGTQYVEQGHIVVTTQPDPETGISFGVARPLEPVLAGVRLAAVRNLIAGLCLVVVALFGVLPLARRMTRNLDAVIAGVERVAHGDLNVRVPVRSHNEFGRLAEAVNSMAVDLLDKEVRIVEQERQNQEQVIRERLLQSEYERKSQELEEARRFQLSLLPKELPRHPDFEVAVAMQTAAEVGGDYYDFWVGSTVGEEEVLTVAVGDATGHGARAGTMVTVIKSLFSTRVRGGPATFLAAAAAAVRRMDLGRMLMALTVAELRRGRLLLSSAGMPPVFVYRHASQQVEELSVPGMPLGGLTWQYLERSVEVAAGDTLLFLSDGFPEATNDEGEPFGYDRVAAAFQRAATGAPESVIERLIAASNEWRTGRELADDLTLVVIRCRA